MKRFVLIVTTLLIAGAALAHQGVKNPAVLERMNNMKAISGQMKILGNMAKAPADFDANQAQAALALISREAGRVAGLFAEEHDDPKSEARPEIWQNWDDFAGKAKEMETLAKTITVASAVELQDALQSLGESCKDCHKLYRE